jgi:hypothetical protein
MELKYKTAPNSGYKQKACHNFCIAPGQFYHDTKLNAVYQFRKTGSGQFLAPGQFYLSPGQAKIAPWCLASRDSFLAKVPGLVIGWTAPPTLSAYTRWLLAINFQSTAYEQTF